MEFLDKVKKTAISVAKVSGRESKKLYSITKLSLEITENQNKIKALYKEIGIDAYKAHKAKKNIARRIRPRLEKIDALEEIIASLRQQIDTLKNTDELGVEDIPVDDADAQDADIVEDDEEDAEDDENIETEPIEPIE